MKEYLAWNIYYIMDPIVYIFDGWWRIYFNNFFVGSRIVLYTKIEFYCEYLLTEEFIWHIIA